MQELNNYPKVTIDEVILEDPLIGAVNKYSAEELKREDSRRINFRSKWQKFHRIEVSNKTKMEAILELFK